ncbi:MAG: PAS domain S-box protein [Verrucomicrobiaceae bacterium]|nr:PAS domain S-box protein [Verrucomicrobiaceae bacterium]
MSGREKTNWKPGAPERPSAGMRNDPAHMPREQIERLVRELRLENAGLRHDLDLFQELYDAAPSGYMTVDARGTVLRVNATMTELLGLPGESIVGRRFSRFVGPGGRRIFLDHQRAVLEQTDGHTCEVPLRRADGETFFAQLDTRLVDGSELAGGRYRCIVSDVTERRLAEEHYQLAFEDNPAPMWIYDERTLRFLAVNDAAVNHYGWTREEFLRLTVMDVRPPEEVPKLLKALKAQRGRRIAFAGEWRHLKKNGTVFDVAVTFSTIRFQGRGARLAMISDVTERRAVEAELRASEGRQAFLVRLSDTLRSLADPVEMEATITRSVGEHLDAAHVGLVSFGDDGFATVERDYTAKGAPSLAGRYHLGKFATTVRSLRRGRSFIVRDLAHASSGSTSERQAIAGLGFAAFVATPIFSEGKLVAMLGVGERKVRHWKDEEVRLVEEAAERAWAGLQRAQAQQALRESEARFRDVLEHSVDAGYRRNLQTGGYDYISPAIKDITGFTAAQIMAHPPEKIFEFIHPADVFHVKRAHKLALKSGKPVRRLEYRFRCKDGSYHWLAESFRVVRDRKGRPLHMIGTVFDISDRKQAEEELRQSQLLARATVEAIPAIVCVLDADGTILDTNQAWRRFARSNGDKQHETTPGVNYLDVCDHVHGLGKEDAARFAAGVRAVAAGQRKAFSMEYDCHSPTEKRWFAGYVSPFRGLGDRRMVVAHVNITAVKLAEERFRTVVESAPDAMVIVDQRGIIRIVNAQAERLFGFRRDELIGAKVEKLVPAGLHKAHSAERRKFTARPATRHMGKGRELRALRKDGSEFPADISLSPLETVTGRLVCAVVRDVTARKRAEQAIRRLNEELEHRVHERTVALQEANEHLRHEMAGRRRLEQEILSISDLERQRIGQDLHDDLGQQIAGAWLMSGALAGSLRSQASPEAGNAESISTTLGRALTLTRTLARGLHPLGVEAGGLPAALGDLAQKTREIFGVPCRFRCSGRGFAFDGPVAANLHRIAQESVTNAMKHGKASHVEIKLTARDGKLTLAITDDGSGFDPANDRHGGMGLRIMRYRADIIGGTLEVRARKGGGTEVVCSLPLPPQNPKGNVSGASPASQREVRSSGSTARVSSK